MVLINLIKSLITYLITFYMILLNNSINWWSILIKLRNCYIWDIILREIREKVKLKDGNSVTKDLDNVLKIMIKFKKNNI